MEVKLKCSGQWTFTYKKQSIGVLLLPIFDGSQLGLIYVELPPLFNLLTLIHTDTAAFMSNNNILGTYGTTRPSPTSPPTTTILHLLPAHSTTLWSKIDAKAPVVLWWMLGDFEVGELWQTAWGECLNGTVGRRFPQRCVCTEEERFPEVTHVSLTTPLVSVFLSPFLAVVQNKIIVQDLKPSGDRTVLRDNSTVKSSSKTEVCLPLPPFNHRIPTKRTISSNSRRSLVAIVVCDHCESTAGKTAELLCLEWTTAPHRTWDSAQPKVDVESWKIFKQLCGTSMWEVNSQQLEQLLCHKPQCPGPHGSNVAEAARRRRRRHERSCRCIKGNDHSLAISSDAITFICTNDDFTEANLTWT